MLQILQDLIYRYKALMDCIQLQEHIFSNQILNHLLIVVLACTSELHNAIPIRNHLYFYLRIFLYLDY